MTPHAYLSPKLALTAPRGFALRYSGQPRYHCNWHMHDCAMLLWPQTGGLKAAWIDEHPNDAAGHTGTVQLSRSTAILLPAATAHNTRASTQKQRHGELYLAPEVLKGRGSFGAFRLDGAMLAMLDALVSSTLDPRSAEPLVDAIVMQIAVGRSLPLLPDTAAPSLGQRMVRRFGLALEWDQQVPLVDAVACELGVSQRQLQRACLQEFGTSPIDIRRRMLAGRARELMAQGQTLAQTSLQLGFASSGHLGRLLRAISH
ncbi:transcriptional regulator, AraC family [Variovorax paradoxus B4]|uniref:Transcriptional regulator, AraC family n=1 Tax=Variovorax paradoxus B4 TaxID=1246301 RepID=T1XNF5_VARPD|nr:helix-turn-helix domain-containing protein [Variovorax paradoxus]AGU53645.1 transcriptional regulator, AraC family [Variovorax paradoxus B4]